MKRSLFRFAALVLGAACMQAMAVAQAPQYVFNKDGSLTMENSLLKFKAHQRPAAANGLSSVFFKPTGYDMVDVMFGQTDYVVGHLMGERFDKVDYKGFRGIEPDVGRLYIPGEVGVTADGSGAKVTQISRGAYSLKRTFVLRRDHSVIETRYEIKNLSGTPGAFSLRLHSALSPGARSKYQSKSDDIFMKKPDGPVALEQKPFMDQYLKKYGSDKHFFPGIFDEEPRRSWVKGASAPLSDNWAIVVNRDNGDGAGFLIDRDKLVGYYNAPGVTLEPVLRSAALDKNDTWTARIFVVAFTGAKDRKLQAVTPLYSSVVPLAVGGGELTGEVIPLFSGTLQVLDSAGKVVSEQKASPTAVIVVKARTGEKGWKIVARDTANAVIGSIANDGKFDLSEPKVTWTEPAKPVVRDAVYDADSRKTQDFLKKPNLTVYADWNSPASEKKAAQEIALQLGAGFTYQPPGMATNLIVIGSPHDNDAIREAGQMKNSFSEEWPGAGKGAIVAYDNFEGSQMPLLVVGGSDQDGVAKAIDAFRTRYLANIKPPSGYEFYATSTSHKIFPYTRSGALTVQDKISLEMARGEYEPAQLVITALEKLRGVEVSVAPLVNADTGEEINPKKQYITPFQRRHGPLWVRFVNYFPTAVENGWSGNPDPLLERPTVNMEAGQTQAIWLTAIMPENARPGLWRSSITVKANNQAEKTIPIEINVWNFAVPRMGILGDPYMYMGNFAPDDKKILSMKNVEALVENMVEHGMRVIHLGPPDMIRWHFSKEGAFKGKEMDWFEVSDDGQLAMDCSKFDEIIETADETAKPYTLRYMMYVFGLFTNESRGEFERTFPNRHAGKPERPKSTSGGYYAQEMMELFKRHIDRKGLTKRFVLKIADEPKGVSYWYDVATPAARAVGMPIMTAFNNVDYAEAEPIIDEVEQWQILYHLHNPEFFKKAQKAGKLVSWYNCGPPPRTSIAAQATELRSYLWQAAKYDLDIISWWGVQNWRSTHENIWTNRYSSWDSMMYPPHPTLGVYNKPGKGNVDTGPIDSIRWELLREGMEDAKYVYLLRDLISQARQKGMGTEADKADAVLNSIWTNVFPTLNDYRPKYEVYYTLRKQVADAILELQGKLGTPAQIRQARQFEQQAP